MFSFVGHVLRQLLHREFLYHNMKEITENSHKYKRKVLVTIVLYAWAIVRFFPSNFIAHYRGTSNFDIAVHFHRHLSYNQEWFFSFCFASLYYLAITYYTKLYLSPFESVIWQEFADLFTGPLDNFKACRISRANFWIIYDEILKKVQEENANKPLAKRFLLTPISKLQAAVRLWREFPLVNQNQLRRRIKLKVMHKIPVKLYIRLIKTLLLEEIVCNALINISYIGLILYGGVFVYQFLPHFAWWAYPILAVEYPLLVFLFGRLIEISLFYSSIAFTTTIFYIGHFRGLNLSLACAIHRVHQRRFTQWQFITKLNTFIRENTHVALIVYYTVKHMWGQVILFTLLSQLPSNVYLIYRVFGAKLDTTSARLTWLILLNQLGLIGGSLMFCAKYCKEIHRGHKMLPRVQTLLGPNLVELKVICLATFERLTGKKIGLTIGPTQTVTYRVIFEIFLLYIGYILTVFQFFLEQ